jgi:hypothetical protein
MRRALSINLRSGLPGRDAHAARPFERTTKRTADERKFNQSSGANRLDAELNRRGDGKHEEAHQNHKLRD